MKYELKSHRTTFVILRGSWLSYFQSFRFYDLMTTCVVLMDKFCLLFGKIIFFGIITYDFINILRGYSRS